RERLKEARAHWDEYFKLASQQSPNPASNRFARQRCYGIEKQLAELERRAGHGAAANAALEKARALAEGILQELASQPAERLNLAYWADDVAELMLKSRRPDEARSLLQQACAIYSAVAPGDPFDPYLTRRAARAYYLLAGLDDRADRVVEAARGFEKA